MAASSVRTRLLRVPKQEQEVHIHTSPSGKNDSSGHVSLKVRRSKSPSPSHGRGRLIEPDYEAPTTLGTLRHNSRWIIVRRNLHRIRFMGHNERERDDTLPDFYIGLQMKRELKRAQDEIKNIHKEENFHAIKHFVLPINKDQKLKTYDTSYVQADDALIYDRLGEEPLALQNLLYYFSKQDVQHGTLFWDFLNEVNNVLSMKRRRTVLVQRLRKLAFTLAVIVYGFIGVMLFLLIISVITTATKMDDPEVKWIENNVDTYVTNSLTLRL